MADGMEFKFTNLRGFERGINDMVRLTGAERPKVLRNTARDYCWAAYRATPKGARKAPNRGFAKAGWLGCLQQLGVKVRAISASDARSAVTMYNDIRTVDGRDRGYIEVANQTPPIVPLDQGGPHNPPHHIAERAMSRTSAKLSRSLDRLRRKMEARWRR